TTEPSSSLKQTKTIDLAATAPEEVKSKRPENPRVGGSIPPLATVQISALHMSSGAPEHLTGHGARAAGNQWARPRMPQGTADSHGAAPGCVQKAGYSVSRNREIARLIRLCVLIQTPVFSSRPAEVPWCCSRVATYQPKQRPTRWPSINTSNGLS